MTKMSRKQCHNYILRTFCVKTVRTTCFIDRFNQSSQLCPMYSAPFGGHWNRGNGKVEAVTSSGVRETQPPVTRVTSE